MHDLGTTELNGYKMRKRLGTKDGKPVYLVSFQHENIYVATAVQVEFPQLPASGAELVAGLRKVCEFNNTLFEANEHLW